MSPTAQVQIRAPVPADEPALLRWRTDAESQRLLMGRGTSMSIEDVREWVARRTSDPRGEFCVIAAGDIARPVGFVQLTRIDRDAGHGWLGIFVDETVRRSGVAGAALRLMEERAAIKYQLATILLEVLADNSAALSFWRAHGYRDTGSLAAHWQHGGRAHDVTLMEKRLLLAPAEYRETKA